MLLEFLGTAGIIGGAAGALAGSTAGDVVELVGVEELLEAAGF
jgi:hypothetical protein